MPLDGAQTTNTKRTGKSVRQRHGHREAKGKERHLFSHSPPKGCIQKWEDISPREDPPEGDRIIPHKMKAGPPDGPQNGGKAGENG